MSPVLANNHMGRRVNYTDRRKNRFERRQESNGAQMLFNLWDDIFYESD